MNRSAARLASTLAAALSAQTRASTSSPRDQLAIDLTASDGSSALASAETKIRSLLHARDAIDEWVIAAELRPPTVRAFEAAAAELLASAGDAFDAAWRSSCATCGQAVRVAAWRWEEAPDADQAQGRPTARRATCAACRALGRRGGDSSALLPGEIAEATPLEAEIRARVERRFAGAADGASARWSVRQLRSLDALSTALERSAESAVMLGALRLTLTEAAVAMARPHRAGRGWWEIAPWQALLDAIDARRRAYLTARPVAPHLAMSSDLSALTYPGGGAIVVRGGPTARTSLAALVARTSTVTIAMLRITVGGNAEEASDRAIAARWAEDQSEPDALLAALRSNDAGVIAAALARLFVAMNAVLRHDPLLVIDLDESTEQLAGVLTAVSLAGGAGRVNRRLDDDRPGLTVSVRLSERPETAQQSLSQIALLSELVVAHGEPVTPQRLLPAYAAARARAAHAAGEVLDAAALVAELRAVADLHATLRPAGSFDQLIGVADGRIFVEGRAERERLAAPAADRADASAFALVDALDGGGAIDHALVALDADPVGIEPALRSALLDAYTVVGDGERHARASRIDLVSERFAILAELLELGPRMGLYVAVAPAIAARTVSGRTLGSRTTIDPIDSSPPLRTRSDRAAYDEVDAILYRRGRAVLFCEVVTGPLPIGEILLQRHAKIASDQETVRLLVLPPVLVPLLQLRLAGDVRLAAAWESGNWHLLATDRIAALARLQTPRLADLEGHLGAEPPQRHAAQLDLASFGWGAGDSAPVEPPDTLS